MMPCARCRKPLMYAHTPQGLGKYICTQCYEFMHGGSNAGAPKFKKQEIDLMISLLKSRCPETLKPAKDDDMLALRWLDCWELLEKKIEAGRAAAVALKETEFMMNHNEVSVADSLACVHGHRYSNKFTDRAIEATTARRTAITKAHDAGLLEGGG